jgi:isocitrate dehydrogenase
MTRIIWQFIKDKLILPYLDIDLEVLRSRHPEPRCTDDQITSMPPTRSRSMASASSARRSPRTKARVEEFGLKKMWKSPERHDPQHPRRRHLPRADHHEERAAPGSRLDQPIIVGRHAFGDQYRATDFKFPGKGKLTIKFVGEDGQTIEHDVFDAPSSGVAMAMYNLDDSIRDFARASLNYGLMRGVRLSVDQEHHPQGL